MQFEVFGPPPPPQRFVNMENRHVRKVRHSGDCFEGIKSGKIPVGKKRIKYRRLEKSNREPIGLLDRIAERRTEFGRGIVIGALSFGRGAANGEGCGSIVDATDGGFAARTGRKGDYASYDA